MTEKVKKDLVAYLSGFVTANKLAKLEQVLPWRTRYVTVVLEDLYEAQNASAVLRTCECFGIQDVHVIEQSNRFKVKKAVAQGSAKWLDLHRYHDRNTDNTQQCLERLQSAGYLLVATTLASDAHSPESVPLDRKIALLFGREEAGLSELAMDQSDLRVKLPMFGFTQSFNISVSAALFISQLAHRLHHSGLAWQLQESEKIELRLAWLRNAIGRKEHVAALEKAFFKQYNSAPTTEPDFTPESERIGTDLAN